MKNFVQPGNTIDIVSGSVLTSGQPIAIGSFLVGVCNLSTAANVPNEADIEGVFDLPKTAALAVAVGDKVYLNTGTGLMTKTNSDIPAGYCILAAAGADTTVRVRLSPGMTA